MNKRAHWEMDWYMWLIAASIGLACSMLCAAEPSASTAPADPTALRATIAQLKAKDAATRYAAAQGLAKMGPAAAEAVPELIALFTDFEKVWVDPKTTGNTYAYPSQAATEACAKIGPKAIPLLSKGLRDADRNVRYGAVNALLMQGDAGLEPLLEAYRQGAFDGFTLASSPHALSPKAVGPLLAMLADKDPKIRLRACDAFRSFQTKEAAQSVAPLIEHLADEDEDVRYKAADALYGQHAAAVEPLIATLRDQNPLKRRAAATILGRLDATAAAPALAAMVGTDKEAGDFAMAALGKLEKGGIAPLAKALSEGTPNARIHSAELLGFMKEKAAADALQAALDAPDLELRRMAVRSLGRLGPEVAPAAGKEILPLLRSDDLELRVEAAQALGLLAEKSAVEDLVQILYTGAVAQPTTTSASQPATTAASQPAATTAPAFMPEHSLERVTTRAGTDQTTQPFDAPGHERSLVIAKAILRVRCNAAGALGLIGDPRAFVPLQTALAKGGKDLRVASAGALGSLHDPRATPLLVPLLEDADQDLVYVVVDALGRTQDAAAAAPLIEYIRAHEREPQNYTGNAVSSLRTLGLAATPALLQVVRNDKQKSIRLMAISSLPRDDKRVPRPLMLLLDESDADVRHAAEERLSYYTHEPNEDDLPRWRKWWAANKDKYPE